MIFRRKRAPQAQGDQGAEAVEKQAAPSGAYETFDFPIFDGKSHKGTMSVSTDPSGRVVYRLKSDRSFKSRLSHTRRK